jgi:hypothetical protein
MVLAPAASVSPDPVGELDLLEDIGEALVDIDRLAGLGIAPGLDESVSAKLHKDLDMPRFPVAAEAMLA